MTITASHETLEAQRGAAISVRELWKVYGRHAERHVEATKRGEPGVDGCVAAVADVSFDVEPGETFVVMGLSGSGKSTLVRCLTRLIEPSAGEVEIDGVDVVAMTNRQLGDARRQDWAMVFQHFGLLPHRKVIHNIAYGLEISGVPQREREARAHELAELVGLTGAVDKYPHELSGGMRQRVGLARALAVRPRLLLLDEPFSALDPLIRTDLQDQLLGLAREADQTSVFITHDLSEALKMGDRIAIMRDGQLVQVGTPEEIVLQPHDDYVRRFALEAPRAKVVRAGSVLGGAPVLGPTQSAADALEILARCGAGSAAVDASTPFAVTSAQLMWAAESGKVVGDLHLGAYGTVSSDAVLSEVMSRLVETGNPVLVTSDGALVGSVTDNDVVRALGVGE